MLTIMDIMNHGLPNDTGNMKRVLRDSLIEFVATTLFVFSGTFSAVSTGRWVVLSGGGFDVARIFPIAFSFGVSILFMAYSIGHLTGGHMNPAVSLMMVLRRQMSLLKMACYWIAQLSGAVLASALVWGCAQETANNLGLESPPFSLGATTVNEDLPAGNAFLIEFMGSLVFYFVIVQTALDKRGIAATGFPAIPIGLSLVVVHICLIPWTGCGVNPARTFGPAMVVCMEGRCDDVIDDKWWVYWVGPFAAALVAAELSNLFEMDVGDDVAGDSDCDTEGHKELADAPAKDMEA